MCTNQLARGREVTDEPVRGEKADRLVRSFESLALAMIDNELLALSIEIRDGEAWVAIWEGEQDEPDSAFSRPIDDLRRYEDVV